MNANHHFSCVVTVALKQELPLDWLKKQSIPLVTLEGALSGALFSLKTESSFLIFITGVGANKAQESARFISERIQPHYVINWGTTGNVSHSHALGDIVIPKHLQRNQASDLASDTRLPLPLHMHETLSPSGTLYSSLNRDTGDAAPDFIDMEAYFQADVFKDKPISFHVIKSVSDYADSMTDQIFAKGLSLARQNAEKLFSFLAERLGDFDICVVIPTFNRAESLCRAIDSVLAQDVPVSDIIIVDDGSDDDTKERVRAYGSQLTYVPILENKGVSYARNLGVQHSQASWIAFLDSDDIWAPNKLSQQVLYLKQHPYYDIIQSEERWIRNGKPFNKKKYHTKREGWLFDLSLERCMISPSSVMLTRRLFNRYLGFDDQLLACEDYDLWLKITRFHPVALDPTESLIKYGGHDDQLSTRYEAMDTFRVKALLAALDREKDARYKERIISVLHAKITVLLNGYNKRGNLEKAQYYNNVLARIRETH